MSKRDDGEKREKREKDRDLFHVVYAFMLYVFSSILLSWNRRDEWKEFIGRTRRDKKQREWETEEGEKWD